MAVTKLELHADVYRAVLNDVPIGVYLVDFERRIVFWNTAAERITGYLAQEVIGRFCHDNLLLHCDRDLTMLCGQACPLAHTMLDGRLRQTDVFLRHKEGQRVPVQLRAVPVRDESGSIVGSVEFFEQRPLTPHGSFDWRLAAPDAWNAVELADRAAMLAMVQHGIAHFAATQEVFSVLCIAIDHADHLRHTDGCLAVKEVVHAVGQTIAGGVMPSDAVGCWGDGRFLALISCGGAQALSSCAERLQHLVQLAAVPWWGDRLSVTVSIGGTVVREGDTAESLIGRATEALDAGLAQGTDRVLVF